MTSIEADLEPVAGNGLLDRRFFLKAGFASSTALLMAKAGGVEREPWMKTPGAPMSENDALSRFESHVQRGTFSRGRVRPVPAFPARHCSTWMG